MKTIRDGQGQDKKMRLHPLFVVGILLLVTAICVSILLFYRSLEEGTHAERSDYLQEISGQIVETTDSVISFQWQIAALFSNRLQEQTVPSQKELSQFIRQEERIYAQRGLSLLVFDKHGNFFNKTAVKSRWPGSAAKIDADSPERQVEITALPTSTDDADEMVFVLKMKHPVKLQGSSAALTHVAVVRNMAMFNNSFQVSSFKGDGENYIVSSKGIKVYREQSTSEVIGDVYNVLKPLERLDFRYEGSYSKLRDAVGKGKSSSMEFRADDGKYYYVTSSPMETNDWSMLSIIPSDVVSAHMQGFMTKTLIGMAAIALAIVIVVSLSIYLVIRFQAGQQILKQQAAANAALQEAYDAASEARDAAEAANRSKTVFLSHMSHDIRTPMNGIINMDKIALENIDDQSRVVDCIKKSLSAAYHLLSLVNDVLDMSRIESGKVRIEEKPFYLDALLDGCYSVIIGQVVEKKIELETDFSGVIKMPLRGDELHLRQIFINILGNAVKFTPEGGTVKFLAKDSVVGNQAEIEVTISDNGIGMNEEFLTKIFEPFTQAEGIERSNYQGTGLGMSIVKQLLDQMGGSVDVESALGKGSTFTIRLRLPVEDGPVQEETVSSAETDLTDMRVLLVEDNEMNMEIAQYVLESSGVQVISAWDGKEALERFQKETEGTFDAILMDVMMPVMDGLEAARAIRQCGKADAKNIPIIAMTANAFTEDQNAALEAGMNRHLAKPLEPEELLRVLWDLYKK